MKTKLEESIDFKKLTYEEFENLCFELILKSGFIKATWRKGGADNGRDIEATLKNYNGLTGETELKYFFECKKYENGLPPSELISKIAWADAEKPDYLLIIISSYLSNNCRSWIEKIQSNKQYKIQIIEGDFLKKLLLDNHKDLIVKYFVADKYISLLNETIDKWILHNLTPNFYTYYYILENVNKADLTINQNVFLYCLYYVFYSRLEELENENYHGIDISQDIEELENIIIQNSNSKEIVLKNLSYVETLSSEGLLSADKELIDKYNYDFIASEIATKNIESNYYNLSFYLFKRISENECVEILLKHNSSLEFKIFYSKKYTFDIYKEVLNTLSLGKFKDKMISNSPFMK